MGFQGYSRVYQKHPSGFQWWFELRCRSFLLRYRMSQGISEEFQESFKGITETFKGFSSHCMRFLRLFMCFRDAKLFVGLANERIKFTKTNG